jgi:uncharacterized protein (DUF2141 family)
VLFWGEYRRDRKRFPREPFDVTPGRYALSAFEDLHGNGILDTGIFGPKEPSAFWRPFHGWHKPRFDEVASQFKGEAHGLDIVLK